MPRYRVQVSYEGSGFHGWQIQPGLRTVQGVFREILGRLGENGTPYGAGRTDAGVHALANEAHFHLERLWDPMDLERALCSLAPPDMGFRAVRPVEKAFHARYDAIGRRYAYVFSGEVTVFNARRAWHCTRLPEAAWVRAELECLAGHRDFAALCLSGSNVTTTECAIQDSQWWTFPKGAMLTIQANRFLYGMIRALVGTLLEGHKRGKAGILKSVLDTGSRSAAGPSAPPWGLYFVQALYPGDAPLPASWRTQLAALAGILAPGEEGDE